MRARSVRTGVATAAAAVLLAACGGSSSGGSGPAANTANAHDATPAAELASAIKALGSAHTLKLNLSLGTSGADLLQIASGLGGDGPTKAQADAIGGDHIGLQFQAPDGKSLRDGAHGGAFALTLGDDSQDHFTLEEVAGSLYGQIDLKYFLDLVNGAPSLHSLQRKLGSAPPFAKDALAGKWISLPAATLKSLAGLAGGQTTPASPSASKLSALQSKALSTLLADVTVTRAASGATDDLKVSFKLRELISDEYAAVAPVVRSLVPGGDQALPPLKPGNIPNVTVNFDAFVTNGALSKVVLDAGQFDTNEHISVPIDLDVTQEGPAITAPSDATPIDFSSLGQLFAGA
ncbi:MAG TPA: hypothetical protein VHD81_10690 [Mycobacteriales bacterium]|nr:hypothetical protein [Mycobacteriales bacterium]